MLMSFQILSLSLQIPFNRPLEEPVAVFAFAIAIFLITPLILKQFRLPGIIGILLAGIIVGPHALNLLSRGETIRLLGEVGLLYLLFVAGLEIDINAFFEDTTRVIVFALLTFLLPMVLGTVAGMSVLQLSLISAILFSTMFSSHTILGYPVLEQLNILKNNAVTTTISVALLTDTAALLILAAVESSQHGSASVFFWVQFIFKLTVFFVGILVIVPRIGRWFFRNVDEESYFEFLFTILIVYGTAYLATFAGADPIVGAFLAGITMNRLVPSTSTLMNRIQFVGNALFIPFFFLSVGMLVRPRIFLRGGEVWIILGVMLGVMVSMKFVSAVSTGRIYDFERDEWLTMFGISIGQGPAAIAIALIGARTGLFTDTLVNAVVGLIVISAIVSPYLTERFGRGIVAIEEQEEYEPSEAPERILIPVTQQTENKDLLLDLAMLIRGSESEEPLHTLTVARDRDQLSTNGGKSVIESWRSGESPDEKQSEETEDQERDGEAEEQNGEAESETEENNTEAEVAEAEETLEDTEEYAAGAEVPIEAQTRVDNDTVNGIVRAIRENRITTVVMGWNKRQQFGRRLFGTTIEQLLNRTGERVLVASLNQPINTTERVVLVIPGRIAAHPGFYGGVHIVKQITEQLGVSLQCLLVNGNTDQYERLVDSVEPETSFEIDTVDSWNQIRSEPGTRFEEGDLVIPLSPRQGSRGWVAELGDLQRDLAGNVPGNLIVLYLAEEDEGNREYIM